MDRFQKHFKMSEQDAAEYVGMKIEFFDRNDTLSCKEIGDGNINYVFRIIDEASGKSVILKQSDSHTRSGQTAVDTDRSRVEAEVLWFEGRIAPGLVPEVYNYDAVMCCTLMEDLRDYESLRDGLIAHRIFPRLSEDITTFLASVLIRTTDCIVPPKEKKDFVKRYNCPDLCDITERLVYTEPYTDKDGSNRLFPPNEEFLKKEIYQDRALRLEAAKLKEQFQSKAQSLLHGDLHTGSIFVNGESTKVLDPEFAFYGPAGYDIGNIIANFIFAWVNAEVTMAEGKEKAEFQDWLEDVIADLPMLFRQKAEKILQEECTEIMAKTVGFSEWFIGDMLTDAAGVAGLELIRRIIGDAKVRDIEGIADGARRVRAERICVLAAKQFIKNRSSAYQDGMDYIDTVKKVRSRLLADGEPI